MSSSRSWRANGGNTILMSAEHYESLQDTLYLFPPAPMPPISCAGWPRLATAAPSPPALRNRRIDSRAGRPGEAVDHLGDITGLGGGARDRRTPPFHMDAHRVMLGDWPGRVGNAWMGPVRSPSGS